MCPKEGTLHPWLLPIANSGCKNLQRRFFSQSMLGSEENKENGFGLMRASGQEIIGVQVSQLMKLIGSVCLRMCRKEIWLLLHAFIRDAPYAAYRLERH